MKYIFILLFFFATSLNAQTLVPITSNMVTTSGNMPADPMQFFDGSINTPSSTRNLTANLSGTANYNGSCDIWYAQGNGYGNGYCHGSTFPYPYYQKCTQSTVFNINEVFTFANNVGDLNHINYFNCSFIIRALDSS